MSQTAHPHKRTRFRDRLLHWILTPLYAFLKARANAPSKTAPRNVPQPVRPGPNGFPQHQEKWRRFAGDASCPSSASNASADPTDTTEPAHHRVGHR